MITIRYTGLGSALIKSVHAVSKHARSSMDKNTVLSFCSSAEALKIREAALRNRGMEVVSVTSAVEDRFEITMGRCGILLICYRLFEDEAQEITRLFKHYCSQGRVVFVEEPSNVSSHAPSGTDVVLPESDGPDEIVKALKLAA
jgi:DNA-binding NarL/FixJ family response regulator